MTNFSIFVRIRIMNNNEEVKFDIKDFLDNPRTKFSAIEYQRIEELEEEARGLLKDEEMKEMAEEDLKDLERQKKEVKRQIDEILEKEKEEEEFPNEMILEIRAGAGGDEASLFAFEVAEMYQRYCELKGWSVRKIDESTNDLGGYKEVSFEIKGVDSYKTMQNETGVHRVQRIPATEKQGRIHTSTITVAVMPVKKKFTVTIKPDELEREVSRSGGAGGQSVNKVESAVRYIHLPTGISVRSTSERSQLKNGEKAMSILLGKLQQLHDEEEAKKAASKRKGQVGTGSRSEKIRTYNFPQDRLTDHRIKKNWSNLDSIMKGELDGIFEALEDFEG